jgi:hypothetical protein
MLEAATILEVSLPRAHSLLREGKLKYVGKFCAAYVLKRHAVLALKKDRDLNADDGRRTRWKKR